MILTCPSCRTRYQTDDAHFRSPGRNVRCAKCGEIWFQAAPETAIAAEPEPLLPEAPSATATPGQTADNVPVSSMRAAAAVDDSIDTVVVPPRRSLGAAIAHFAGWSALILLIGGIGWAVIQYRDTVAAVWPQSASLYAALGMPVNARGIALTDIAYKQEYEDGLPVLSVTGKVVNVSNRELPVPELRVVLLDAQQHELYQWTFDAGIPTLPPGAESPFMTRLSSPPPEARNLNVRFADSTETP